ncbi:MAG: hypothetical protein ACI9TV_000922 [Sulfurimonas sp.]|uniref:hypothetical protein n=1 Tax=Sulfurimonas sp. TaxID=2022749 RepID=UPI0039E21876
MINDTVVQTEKLKLFYLQNFSKKEIESLCFDIAQIIVDKYFLSNVIDNATYEKDIFKIIKKILILKLNTSFDMIMEFNALLSIYIFKKHFKLIFTYLSELIMVEIGYSNYEVMNFLKYYSLDIILVDKKKYIVPQIKEDNGPRWNVTSMQGILKTYVKTQEQLTDILRYLKDLDTQAHSYYINNINPFEHNVLVEKRFQNLEVRINSNTQRIDIVHDSLSILQDKDEILKANRELKLYQEQRAHLRELKAQLTKDKVKQYKILAYEDTLKKIKTIQREIRPKKKIIQQNKKSYLSIKNALICALISKKQAV